MYMVSQTGSLCNWLVVQSKSSMYFPLSTSSRSPHLLLLLTSHSLYTIDSSIAIYSLIYQCREISHQYTVTHSTSSNTKSYTLLPGVSKTKKTKKRLDKTTNILCQILVHKDRTPRAVALLALEKLTPLSNSTGEQVYLSHFLSLLFFLPCIFSFFSFSLVTIFFIFIFLWQVHDSKRSIGVLGATGTFLSRTDRKSAPSVLRWPYLLLFSGIFVTSSLHPSPSSSSPSLPPLLPYLIIFFI